MTPQWFAGNASVTGKLRIFFCMCSIWITFTIYKNISTVNRTFRLDLMCCFTLLVRFHRCLKLWTTDMIMIIMPKVILTTMKAVNKQLKLSTIIKQNQLGSYLEMAQRKNARWLFFGRTRKSCGNTCRLARVPTAFLALPNFHSCFY